MNQINKKGIEVQFYKNFELKLAIYYSKWDANVVILLIYKGKSQN